MRLVLLPLLLASMWACSPRPAQPARAPEAATPVAEPRGDWKQVEPTKQKVALVPEPAGLPAPDAACQELAARKPSACGPTEDVSAALDAALKAEGATRDERLTCLEGAPALPPGFVRALRAELAPLSCADVLALPLLEPRHADLARPLEDTLIALAIAGRLSRLVQQPPELPVPFDKLRFMDFFQAKLKPWIVTQAAAIHDLSLAGARLTPYAKGIVAVEAGLADMRFVSVVRGVALPKEMSDDAEVREAYYATLDEALEPRKARGRDAALVGLRELAHEGIATDARVQRARSLLSQVYAGRRIDALDGLLLPPLAPAASAPSEVALAARLPTFYSGLLLAEVPLDATLLRALLERGVPRPIAERVDPTKLDDQARLLWARALLQRGQIYLRAEDFASSARLTASDKPSPEQALYHALGLALQDGPRDAAELLLRGPQLPSGSARVAELDRLAAQGNAMAPLAAFDAAYLLSLAPPQNDAKFWDDLAARFEKSARGLREPARRKQAQDAAKAARDTAKALRSAAK